MLTNKTIKFEEKEWKEFGDLCEKLGYSRSKLLRNFVKDRLIKLKKVR